MRTRAIHALHGNGQQLFAGIAYCDNPRATEFTMQPWKPWGRDITCRVCLYRLGLYVPLVKLAEHQRSRGKGALFELRVDPKFVKILTEQPLVEKLLWPA